MLMSENQTQMLSAIPRPYLELRSVTKSYGGTLAVNDINLSVAEGECLSLLGPSGCGKTTLLRLIAGLAEADAGDIICGGKRIDGIKPYARGFGVVFQDYALFPHMTVAKNIGYGLKIRKYPTAQIQSDVANALAKVGLTGMEDRYPHQLSGGQQQRVALARAIVTEPTLLLLDEPLGALDKNLREDMQVELRAIQRRLGLTTILVTHDQEEAMTLSDRVAVMSRGRIEQIGTSRDVYQRPSNSFVAKFLGTSNLLNAKILAKETGNLILDVQGLQFHIATESEFAQQGDTVTVSIRPESVKVAAAGDPRGFRAYVVGYLFQGHRALAVFRTSDGAEIRAFISSTSQALSEGDEVSVQLTGEACVVLAETTSDMPEQKMR